MVTTTSANQTKVPIATNQNTKLLLDGAGAETEPGQTLNVTAARINDRATLFVADN